MGGCGRWASPRWRTRSSSGGVVEVLNAVYEADFLGFSYGFRPGRGPHDALDALSAGIYKKRVNWVLDADIRDFFTSLDQSWLAKFLGHRIADQRVLRLIGKWLSAGVIENGTWSQTVEGSPQGASVSPLLANIYLHYVLDQWVQWWRRRHARGDVIIVRFADLCRVRHKSHYAARRVMPRAVVKVLVSGGWGGGGLGIIRACDPVGSPSGCGKADSLQPATAGTAPTSGVEIRPSTCRNRSNERVAVTSVLADQTRTHRRL
jgi:hypothetical protein